MEEPDQEEDAMQSTPEEKTPLERSLDAVARAVEAWDPDTGGDVTTLLVALRELDLRFDPRRDRLSSALCLTSMKLLEEISLHGSVRAEAAVGAVGELTRGLRESLGSQAASPAPALRTAGQGKTLTLGGAGSGSSGLSLSLRSVESQSLADLMGRLNMLTPEQIAQVYAKRAQARHDDQVFAEVALELGFASPSVIESAQRLHARGKGEKPAPRAGGDPWGDSPL
jgi:hypothetical protein